MPKKPIGIKKIFNEIWKLMKRKNFRTIGLMSSNTWNDVFCLVKFIFNKDENIVKGNCIVKYEDLFSKYMGGGSSYSFWGGRVALAAILDALDIQDGDEIIVPGYTCVAVPNPILFINALPIYVDIDANSCNIDPLILEGKITPRTKAVVVQHTFGLPADIDPIIEIARKHDLKVIEDCTHALGAIYKGKLVGTYGDAAFFSSEQSKVISTGMGGIAFTKDAVLANKIKNFQQKCEWPDSRYVRKLLAYLLNLIVLKGPYTSFFGDIISYILFRTNITQQPETTPEEFCGKCPPHFYKRLSNAQAAIGISQLKNLEENIFKRNNIALHYDLLLKQLDYKIREIPDYANPIYLRYPIWAKDKNKFFNYMKSNEIHIGIWFTSTIHPEEVKYEDVCYIEGSCPKAEYAVKHIVNLPCHPRMSIADVKRIIYHVDMYYKAEHYQSDEMYNM